MKLKEYAAAGVPWLASPIGPYAGLGEQQGGRLVADDRWYEELVRLIEKPRERRKLAKRGAKWVAERDALAARRRVGGRARDGDRRARASAGRKRPSCARRQVVRMISTEQGAWCETLFGTEPSRKRFAPVMPLLPTMIRSLPCSSATSRIASAGSP